jgi:hypothetical protein
MATEDDSPAQGRKERRPVRLRPTRKKRYGRASLTIRRWGGLDELVGESDVARKINMFRAGEATAEKVAWSFVRARVEGHSPTFRWNEAELERLIQLVTACSDSPHFTAATAVALAEELVKAQDETRETLRRLSEQFSSIFGNVGALPQTLFSSRLTRWAEENQRTFAALSRSLAPRMMAGVAGLAAPSSEEVTRMLGLMASTTRPMFPVLVKTPELRLSNLFAQRIRLPDTVYGEFTKSFQRSLDRYATQAATPAIHALARQQSFTVADVLGATQEAAELAERRGDREDAAELVALSAEAAEVIDNPSTERLEQTVTDFSERFDDFRAQYENDQKSGLALEFFLWFLAIYLAVFQDLLDHLTKR